MNPIYQTSLWYFSCPRIRMRVYENRLSALCDYFLSYFKEVLRMKSWEHPLLNSVGAEGKRHHMSDWLHLSLAHVCLRPILKQNLTIGLMLKRRYELLLFWSCFTLSFCMFWRNSLSCNWLLIFPLETWCSRSLDSYSVNLRVPKRLAFVFGTIVLEWRKPSFYKTYSFSNPLLK